MTFGTWAWKKISRCITAFRAGRESRHGAPLRLRAENQSGYKMVKWIERIEFVQSETFIGKGEGGYKEDDDYFDLLPNI
jgi:DMSO/TMAO reductase YedYZ molybdopterin-dependent catalytic subunit